MLPEKFWEIVFTELHVNLAHLGVERVLDLARQRFYWPNMESCIRDFVQKKCRCLISRKPNVPERAPLVPIESTYPLEMVSLDYMHLDKCKRGMCWY